MTANNKLTLPLNDVQELRCGAAWTRGLKFSVIQRGTQYPVESHGQGQGGTSSLPLCNQQGDSRAERENDSRVSEPSSLPRQSHSGDSSVALLPLNDVQELRCAAGCGGNRRKVVRNARTVDAGGSRPPPSSSRSGDPPVRGRAVRCRYPYATNRGIPARSARMTAEFQNRRRYPGRTNRSITLPQNEYPAEYMQPVLSCTETGKDICRKHRNFLFLFVGT